MVALQLFPVVLSLLVLGAHFLRAGNSVLVLGVLMVLALLFVRRPWAARVVQITLLLGTLEWGHTLVTLAVIRMQVGDPVRRLLIILGPVAAVSLLSAWLMQVGALRHVYRLGPVHVRPRRRRSSSLR
jgi:hypothetical protein